MVMEVVVRKTTRGPNFKKTLQVNESDTLYQLKSKIYEVFGISPNTQYLHCFGRDLDGDTQTLEGLGVKDESVIFIVQYASPKRRSWEQLDHYHLGDAAGYQVMKPGINFQSSCNNTSCKAFEKMVIINVGFRSKSVLQKDRWELNKCPACHIVCDDIRSINFTSCKWKYKGYTDRGEKIQEEGVCNIKGESASSPSNNYKWSYLEISAIAFT